MSDTSMHITWNKILAICSAFIIPGFGLFISVVIFGTRIDDKVTSIQVKQEKQDVINGEFRTDIKYINSKIDTVQQRQLQYHYENLIRQAKSDKR